MENTEKYSQLLQSAFSDIQMETTAVQEAQEQAQEKKEQIQGILAPFEAEGLREGVGGLISQFKTKAVDTIKKAGEDALNKAKQIATDKLKQVQTEAETKLNQLKQESTDKMNQQEDTEEDDEAPEDEAPEDDLADDADADAEAPGGEIGGQPASEVLPEFEGDNIMEQLRTGDPSMPDGDDEITQQMKGESGANEDEFNPDLENDYSEQDARPPGEGDLEMKSFTGDEETQDASEEADEGEDVGEDVGKDVGEDVGEEVGEDVGETVAETALDIDPITAVAGLAIGIASLLGANLFSSHTDPPPQVDFNVSNQLGVF